MCMNHPSYIGESFIQNNMRCRIGRWFKFSFHYIAIQINNNHILGLHIVIGNSRRLYDHQTFFTINSTYITPSENNQSMFNQI